MVLVDIEELSLGTEVTEPISGDDNELVNVNVDIKAIAVKMAE